MKVVSFVYKSTTIMSSIVSIIFGLGLMSYDGHCKMSSPSELLANFSFVLVQNYIKRYIGFYLKN